MNIAIKHLRVKYKRDYVINDLSFTVKSGDFFTILGQSGSGKSTILKAIAGLHDQHDGSIHINNQAAHNKASDQRAIAYVFQKPLLFPHLSVWENIAFGPNIHHWTKEAIDSRVEELLCLLQIEDLGDRMPNELSGGQQQRVAIARALALNHQILLMDEPFSSLDPSLREEMGLLVKSIQKQLGLTVIFVTHDVHEAMTYSDQILFLSDGDLIQLATPHRLYNYPINQEVASFMGSVNWLDGRVVNGSFVSPHSGLLEALNYTSDQILNDGPASLLLRPCDLGISSHEGPFKVISNQRIGSQTMIRVGFSPQSWDHEPSQRLELDVISFEALTYPLNSSVSLVINNPYGHIISHQSS